MRRAKTALYGDVGDGAAAEGQKGQKPPIGLSSEPIGAIVPIGRSSQSERELGWADEAAADFEERAGIAEYEGGLGRSHAEVLAALSTAPGDVDSDARAKVIDFAARHLERMHKA